MLVASALFGLGSMKAAYLPQILPLLVGFSSAASLGSAGLLLSHARAQRSSHHLFLGCAYIIYTVLAAMYLATFPDIFANRGGRLGSDQVALDLWILWHAAFPLLVMVAGFMSLVGQETQRRLTSTKAVVRAAIASLLLALVCGSAIIAGGPSLPKLVVRGDFSEITRFGIAPTLIALYFVAIYVTIGTQKRSDMFAVLVGLLFASSLDSLLGISFSRFTVGWYAGKVTGLIASSLLVVTYVIQFSRMNARRWSHNEEYLKTMERRYDEVSLLAETRLEIDTLTGLWTRNTWLQALRHELQAGSELSVVVLDMDRFRDVNDLAHPGAGDEVLAAIAARIRGVARAWPENRLGIGRSGVDGFLMFLPAVDVSRFVGKLITAMDLPHHVGDHVLRLTASIGIAQTDSGRTPIDELLRRADLAMLNAKSQGGNRVRLFTALDEALSLRRKALRVAMVDAVRLDEYRLVYQPIWSLATGTMVSAEALIRWESASLGSVGPAEFIPEAERTDEMLRIGSWVIGRALERLGRWNYDEDRHLTLAINVSFRQILDPNFFREVTDLLIKHRVDPHSVEFEVTETVAMVDTKAAISLLGRFRALGIRIALDDFGTRYSSLTYLHELPADIVKLDKSFVDGLPGDPKSLAIVSNLLRLSHELGREVVAEGVETFEQLAMLRQAGCDYAQGYLLAKPLSEEDFLSLAPSNAAIFPLTSSDREAFG